MFTGAQIVCLGGNANNAQILWEFEETKQKDTARGSKPGSGGSCF